MWSVYTRSGYSLFTVQASTLQFPQFDLFSLSLRLSRFLTLSHPLYTSIHLFISIPLDPSLSLSVSPWPSLFYSTLCLLFRPLVSSLIQHADEIGQHYDPSTQGVMSLLLEEFSSVSKLVQKQLDLADTYVE